MRIKQFLIAQHTLWFKRCCTSTRDNWRVDLTVAVYGGPRVKIEKEAVSSGGHRLLKKKTV